MVQNRSVQPQSMHVPMSEAKAHLTDLVRRAEEGAARSQDVLYGKGVHPAGLNFGDCFAYALAKSRACPLLFAGDEFTQTDIETARSP